MRGTSHLLADGYELYIIKRLLGHSSIKTTCGYLHVDPDHIKTITSPLDFLTEDYRKVRP